MPKFQRWEHGFTLVELMIVLTIIGVLSIGSAPRLTVMLERRREQAVVDLVTADLTFARRLALNRKTLIQFLYTNENVFHYTIRDFYTNQEYKTVTLGGIRFGAGWSFSSSAFKNGVCFDPQGLPTDLTGQPRGGELLLLRDGAVCQGFRLYRTTGLIEPFPPEVAAND